jgi:hypothetical protein
MRVSAKSTPWGESAVLAIKMLGPGCSFNGNQSGDTDLLLLNKAEGGYGENVLDPHLDALRVIVTATDDQKGRMPACWNNHTRPAGSSVILFAPNPSDTTLNLG